MNHAIRNGHYKYGINTELVFQTMDHKATKEKFQAKKLQQVQTLPAKKIGKHIGPINRKIKGISSAKSGRKRNHYHHGQNQSKRREVHCGIAKHFFLLQAKIAQRLLKNFFDNDHRHDQIKK